MRMDWNPMGALVFVVSAVALTFLIYTNKVPHEALGALLGWLVPSPIGPKAATPEVKP